TYYVVFQALDSSGKEIGIITNDLKVSQGSTWVAQWQPPFNVRYENCTMTPYVYKGGMDDYMIVDLNTWKVTYEPMSTQAASNEKYNTDEYKTAKMAFRKVPAGDYWIGGPETGLIYEATNSYHKCHIAKDFYIGVFHVTVAQYDKIVSNTASTSTYPKSSISYNTIRGSAGAAARPSTGICATMNSKAKLESGALLVAGAKDGFDLPTVSMWEIAARAGETTKYPGADDTSKLTEYSWYNGNGGWHPVGQKKENSWGLYDMVGDAWHICRDTWNPVDCATLQPEGLTPINSGSASYCFYQGASISDRITHLSFRFSARHIDGKGNAYGNVGFRLAFFPD
ncbi:MAG: SUMF1/EgtB/PvdO family nonheme iron enzyme, partial [Kiritimatiellae bacterium]|nr:SUMF1/EgtB/PvdO family nonheme iron enzyme [Kiritimatiellia bacterium]